MIPAVKRDVRKRRSIVRPSATPAQPRMGTGIVRVSATRPAIAVRPPPVATTATVTTSRLGTAATRARLDRPTGPIVGRATHEFGTGASRLPSVPVSRPVRITAAPARQATIRQAPIDYKKKYEESMATMKDELAAVLEEKRLLESLQELLNNEKTDLTHDLNAMKGVNEGLLNENDKLKRLNEGLQKENHKLKEQLRISVEILNEKEVLLRQLHNDNVDLKGQIRVAVRVRPKLTKEADMSDQLISFPKPACIKIDVGKIPIQLDFETVMKPCMKQQQVFEEVKDVVTSVLHGYNVSLIAFGQTGSGKTFTMRGGAGDEQGIIPRAVAHLMDVAKKLELQEYKFDFSVSFFEVYNNDVYDLFADRNKLALRISDNSVVLQGIQEISMRTVDQIKGLLDVADRIRKTSATKCNADSSRSHAIFQVNVKASKGDDESYTAVLKCVDLAGSERAKESEASGDTFKEMTEINKSLSALQKCINMQRAKQPFVPYRETKLTILLRDCLGAGSSKTMVIIACNPTDAQISETKRCLEFAAKMRETHVGVAKKTLGDVRMNDLTFC